MTFTSTSRIPSAASQAASAGPSRCIIAALRVKNESWVIKYTLSALSTFVDKIVVVDDGSEDDTVELCKSFPKVVAVHENKKSHEDRIDEARDWNTLTRLAKKHGADWILYTDADEMLEPAIASFCQDLSLFKDYNMIRFRKISPWKGLDFYRVDSLRFDNKAENTLNPVLVNAQCRVVWTDGRGSILKKFVKRLIRGERFLPSLGRGFPAGIGDKVLNNNDILSVHFNHLSMDRLLRKQVFYALVEKRRKPHLSRNEIVKWVSKGWSEDGIKTKPVKKKWLWNEFIYLLELNP